MGVPLKPISIPSLLLLVSLVCLASAATFAIGEKEADDLPFATVINDEGGPVILTGQLAYSNAHFTTGVDEPLIILEDQAGFIDRDEHYILPLESQVLGQITSDFFTSPFSYSLALPQMPSGAPRDVDNDAVDDSGVMVFAVAHWTNIFGDRFLEERDLRGGGWSTGYASTRASSDVETRLEIIGGKFVIYATEAGQGFPAGFGADGLLFSADDPIVIVPQGYSTVDMDAEPFVFDRAARQTIDLYEPETAAIHDFSELEYAAAFDAMLDLFRREYAYTDLYALDWDALHASYRPRFAAAEADEDTDAYALAMRDFIWEIPDGHVGMPFDLLGDLFRDDTDGGVGLALTELDDGRVVAGYVLPGGPAAEAGMEVGAEILAWDGGSVEEALSREFVWAKQALSTPHALRLQQLRYITRFPLGSSVDVTFRNPESEADQSATLETIAERASFSHSSFYAGIDGWELPVEFEILPSGYGYVVITSFSDNERLTVQLWERMIQTMIDEGAPGLIIDMRQNGGGSGFLADQLGAYFYHEPHILGYSSAYNTSVDGFYLDPRSEDRFILPPEELRYDGALAVIIAPGCYSACEFFTYNLTIADRAAVIGHYPTGGLGGAIDDFLMPEDMSIRFTVTRAMDGDKNIHIEAQGVQPTALVPVTYESLFEEGDGLLRAAVEALNDAVLGELIEGGELSLGQGSVEVQANGIVAPGTRVRYRAILPGNRAVSVYLRGDDDEVDTVLGIYNEAGTQLLAENDDADEETRSSALLDLDVGANAAAILLEVRVEDAEMPQAFTLRIVEAAPDEAEAED